MAIHECSTGTEGSLTVWITSRTNQGLAFHLEELKPAGIQMNGDLAMVRYWVKTQWVGKAGAVANVNLP